MSTEIEFKPETCVEAFLQQEIRTLFQQRDELQAKVDSLMLEYCPDEMTAEQIANYEKHQKKVAPETEAKVDAAIAKIEGEKHE